LGCVLSAEGPADAAFGALEAFSQRVNSGPLASGNPWQPAVNDAPGVPGARVPGDLRVVILRSPSASCTGPACCMRDLRSHRQCRDRRPVTRASWRHWNGSASWRSVFQGAACPKKACHACVAAVLESESCNRIAPVIVALADQAGVLHGGQGACLAEMIAMCALRVGRVSTGMGVQSAMRLAAQEGSGRLVQLACQLTKPFQGLLCVLYGQGHFFAEKLHIVHRPPDGLRGLGQDAEAGFQRCDLMQDIGHVNHQKQLTREINKLHFDVWQGVF
jgi:hypothetical protein